MSEIRKRGLGRGFDSLIPEGMVETEFDVTAPVDESGARAVSYTHLLPSRPAQRPEQWRPLLVLRYRMCTM